MGISQKYLLKNNSSLYLPPVTIEQGNRISQRYGIERVRPGTLPQDEDTNFWQWAQRNSTVEIFLVNDKQTAENLVNAGYAAISPNTRKGFLVEQRNGEQWEKNLEPELRAFCPSKRQFYLVSKVKSDPIAQKKNWKNTNTIGIKLITEKCQVKVIDSKLELTTQHGGLEKIIKKAPSFSRWQVKHLKDLNVKPDLELNVPDLKTINLRVPQQTQLMLLKSPKGTGKTELLIKLVNKARKNGRNVIYVTHRRNLGREGCKRLGLRWVEEPVKRMPMDDLIEELIPPEDIQGDIFDGFNSSQNYSKSELISLLLDKLGIEKLEDLKPKTLGLCSDSLRKDSQAGFYPREWYGADVILDEGEQSTWHTLNAKTEVSKHRVEVLENFQRLIRNAIAGGGRIFLSDADLSDVSVNYIENLAGQSLKTFTLINHWQPEEFPICISYKNQKEIITGLTEALGNGQKAFVCCSSQKIKSKWSTQNLETHIRRKFPHLRILRIDAESVANPNHPAYGCTGNLNAILGMYDVVLASPVIETGVSIPHSALQAVVFFSTRKISP